MIIQLKQNIQQQEKDRLIDAVLKINYKPAEVKTQFADYLVCTGKKEFDIREIGLMSGVCDVHRVSSQYKLVSRKWKVDNTSINLGDGVQIKRDELAMLAGPCSIEGIENAEKTIEHLVKNDIKIMRTMVFKPRSSPYS